MNTDAQHHALSVLLLGSNGQTGRRVLELALADGHSVTAVVRERSRLPEGTRARLTVQVGDPCDAAFLERIMPGHDVVVSALGPRWPTPSAASVYSRSADAIVSAMWSSSVQRLIVTSSALLFPAADWPTKVLKRVVSPIVHAATAMEDTIRQSGVDWLIVRTGFLNNADNPNYRSREDGMPEGAGPVSRDAVARFITDHLADASGHRATVGLSH